MAQWHAGRVVTPPVSAKMLALATWKSIPSPLQRSIVEHYED